MPPEASVQSPRPIRRVALVLHAFDRGGSGRVAGYLLRGFRAAGLDAELIVFAKGGEAEAAVVRLIGEEDHVRYLGRMSGSRPLDLLRGLPALVRLLKRERPDAVIAAANNAALVTAIAVRLAGLRTRFFIKTTNPIASSRHRGFTRWLRRAGYRRIFRWTRAVWTLSAPESAEMRAAFPAFADIFEDVANPYVTPEMLALPDAIAPNGGKTIICVARLTAQKRLERLIAAFAEVRTAGTRLLILGEGEDRPQLESQIARLGLGDRVSLPGFTAGVAQALHAADLFVLTSDYEGLPAVVLEAMAANCPVLSTDCFPAAQALLGQAEGCGIIADTAPAPLAAQIDRHLALPRPASLRAIAERYAIDAGVASHLAALLRHAD